MSKPIKMYSAENGVVKGSEDVWIRREYLSDENGNSWNILQAVDADPDSEEGFGVVEEFDHMRSISGYITGDGVHHTHWLEYGQNEDNKEGEDD